MSDLLAAPATRRVFRPASLAGLPIVELLARVDALGSDGDGVSALYRAWIAANAASAPEVFVAWFNLGVTEARAGRTAEAAQAYRAALRCKPDFHAASLNLGLMLEQGGNPDEALRTWQAAVQPDEARIALLNQQARLLEQHNQFERAERLLRASLATTQDQPDVVQHWVHLRQKMCLWPVLDGTAVGLSPQTLFAECGPLAALSLTDDITMQTDITRRWLARKTAPAPTRLSPPMRYGHRRLRVGYLSSDLGRHAMGYLIAELFERHDRERIELYGYCIGRDDGSELRRRIVAAFEHFQTLAGTSDEDAARRIAADEIDVLIDLNGLTAGARPQILRWRPAPVQATYLGFVGPVALPELDYLLCDDYVVPPDAVPLYAPAPLAVARYYQANDTRRAIGPSTDRAANGLPEDAFVFCSFSNHFKITEELFACWCAILARVPHAVLWLAEDNPWSQRNLRNAAAENGIMPTRLIFAPRAEPAHYIARFALADLYLDTFPYAAGTVASDAIRMRLPLLTICGRAFASRMAARLMDAIGAADGIVANHAEYVERAVALATDPARYAAHKAAFTETAWHDTIGDVAGFAAEFDATLLRMHATLVPN